MFRLLSHDTSGESTRVSCAEIALSLLRTFHLFLQCSDAFLQFDCVLGNGSTMRKPWQLLPLHVNGEVKADFLLTHPTFSQVRRMQMKPDFHMHPGGAEVVINPRNTT